MVKLNPHVSIVRTAYGPRGWKILGSFPTVKNVDRAALVAQLEASGYTRNKPAPAQGVPEVEIWISAKAVSQREQEEGQPK